MIINRGLSMLGLLLLSGCAAIPIDQDGSGFPPGLKNERIAMVAVEESPLYVMTGGSAAAGGAVGGMVGAMTGQLIDDLTRPNGSAIKLPSPSYLVASALRDRLSADFSLKIDPVPNSLSAPGISADPPATGKFQIEVFTDTNLLSPRPLAWTTYEYRLRAHARLLAPDGKVLWQAACDTGGLAGNSSLQLNRVEFKNNDGQRLKDILKLAANQCAEAMAGVIDRSKL